MRCTPGSHLYTLTGQKKVHGLSVQRTQRSSLTITRCEAVSSVLKRTLYSLSSTGVPTSAGSAAALASGLGSVAIIRILLSQTRDDRRPTARERLLRPIVVPGPFGDHGSARRAP